MQWFGLQEISLKGLGVEKKNGMSFSKSVRKYVVHSCERCCLLACQRSRNMCGMLLNSNLQKRHNWRKSHSLCNLHDIVILTMSPVSFPMDSHEWPWCSIPLNKHWMRWWKKEGYRGIIGESAETWRIGLNFWQHILKWEEDGQLL